MIIFERARLRLAALKAIEARTAALLRAADFTAASRLLSAKTAKYGAAYEPICRKLADRFVAVEGWDDAFADHQELTSKGNTPAAFGMDVSASDEGDIRLGCRWYGSSAYRFSGAGREELLREFDGGAPKWKGRSLADGSPLAVSNLAPLCKALAADPNRFREARRDEEATAEYAACRLGTWTLYLRAHWAIKQRIDKSGLPRAMPVLVGEHGFGPPSFASVYLAEGRSGYEADVARILEARRRDSTTDYDRDTDKMIADLTERRRSIRSWPEDRDPDKRRAFIEFARAHDALVLGALTISSRKAAAEMDEGEFRQLLSAIRQARSRSEAA